MNSTEQAAQEPQLHERNILMEVPDPIAGTMWVSGESIKFSRTPMVIGSAPTVGQHTQEILQDVLNMSDENLNSLVNDNIVNAG